MRWNNFNNNALYAFYNNTILKDIKSINNYPVKFSDNLYGEQLKEDKDKAIYRTPNKLQKNVSPSHTNFEYNDRKKAFLYAAKVGSFANRTSLFCFSNYIAGLLYTPFKMAGCEPSFIVAIIGKQQTMKTTIAKLCCCKFENEENANVIGFSSSLPEIKEFISDKNLKDTTATIDDGYTCSTTKEKRIQDVKLSEIVRFTSNNIEEIKKIGNENIKFSNQCTVTITGEQLQDVASILSRCIIVLHKTAPNTQLLSNLQDKQLDLNYFTSDFLKWVAENFKNIVSYIKNEFLILREQRNDGKYNYERLTDNYNILFIAHKIFLRYGYENNFINSNYLNNHFYAFQDEIEYAKRIQLKYIERYGTDINYDFLKAIKFSYRQGIFNLKKKAKKPFDNYDGTIKGENLYLKKKNLMFLMRKYFK